MSLKSTHTGVSIGNFNFSKLRTDLYSIIHDKDRNIDELVWLWDFFKEHEVVIDTIIKQERWQEVVKKIKKTIK